MVGGAPVGVMNLRMLADTMMPEAFENVGRLAGLFTTLGFALAFGVSVLE
jgi:ZIP family zinc transporter